MNDAPDIRSMRILIADDNDSNSELLRQLLAGAGYHNVAVTRDAGDVPGLCVGEPRPDLLLLDLHMPALSGYEIMARLRPVLSGPPYLAVLVVTADVTAQAKHRALSLGASDFITKPVDAVEVLLRTANQLRTSRLQRQLNSLVLERTVQLERSRHDTLACLAVAAEYRDDVTGRHTQRVGRIACRLAARLGLSEQTVALIGLAAPLHDIGKIAIPDEILLKPGALTEREMAVMHTHVDSGAQILARGNSPELALARDIALHHHERWDGGGYKSGLAGTAIPLAARITAVADAFDAISHARPYKPATPVTQAVQMILAESARQFDPDVVAAFAQLDHAVLIDIPDTLTALPRARSRPDVPHDAIAA